MSHLAYLSALLVSLAGLAVLDHRFRLAVFDQPRRALLTVALGVAFFLVWDLVGVGLGIFFVGSETWLTGIRIAREVPLEEPLFLVLLTYQTLLLWRALSRRDTARRRPAASAPHPGGAAA
ncbi:lycopene cyclase domain-containing protein [Demequina mangrovi]|uniref:Lycopene cyclase domain-containing protein n=1 Tax=Demequina mangrovi TaxID=1043493 RepID=A0A1H6ZZ12_9MICO|nr:lycopene cyclase domain-containing protein [Demequina mangrovi]SEJ56867.1 lycopene cyclase domain-containing protein [Demequina mangrovi]